MNNRTVKRAKDCNTLFINNALFEVYTDLWSKLVNGAYLLRFFKDINGKLENLYDVKSTVKLL